jgi:hypothetical protein
MIKETGHQRYAIKINNFFMPLPFEVNTSAGTTRTVIGKEGITVTSETPPIIDGKGHYLKKVSM